MDIGKRMRSLRESAHVSQVEVAKMTKSSQATITKVENGKAAPSVKLLLWWADYFDVSLDFLCCRTDDPQGRLYECRPQRSATDKEMAAFIEMCFDPRSPYNAKLKQSLLDMIREGQQ